MSAADSNENDTPEEARAASSAGAAGGAAAPDDATAQASGADEQLEASLEAEATEEGMPAAAGDETDTGISDLSDDDAEAIKQATEDLAAERLADLQRITAEYANFRRRTANDLDRERRRAKADAARQFLSVLDDLDLAEKHGDLVEGSAFATIAQKMRQLAENLGAVKFGAQGDAFDPNIHEAVFQQPSPDVKTATVADVVRVGYTLEDELVRPAQVVVWMPQE